MAAGKRKQRANKAKREGRVGFVPRHDGTRTLYSGFRAIGIATRRAMRWHEWIDNPKPAAVSQIERYRNDPEYRRQVLERQRTRYANNTDYERERVQRYKHANPDKVAEWQGKRGRLAAQQSDGTLTRNVIGELLARSVRCPYCSDPYRKSKKSVDHIRPLSKGGIHGISNVLICCLTCNISKNGRTLTEWLQWKRANHALLRGPGKRHEKNAGVPVAP